MPNKDYSNHPSLREIVFIGKSKVEKIGERAAVSSNGQPIDTAESSFSTPVPSRNRPHRFRPWDIFEHRDKNGTLHLDILSSFGHPCREAREVSNSTV